MKDYKEWEGEARVEPKLDGIYAKATKDGLVTKTGKPVKNADHIAKALRRHFKKNPGSKIEGELYRKGQPFEDTLSTFRGGKGKKLKLYVHGEEKPSRLIRHVRRVKGKVVKDEGALKKVHEKNLRKLYEGSVIKRGSEARKLKPKHDEELAVVGSKVRKDGKAGVVSVKGRDGKVFKVQGSASEAMRANPGSRATVVYEKSRGGSVRGGKLKSVRNYDFSEAGGDPKLTRYGVSGYNKPKRTPGHPTKSHVVVVKKEGKVKVVRFGEQGAKVNQTVKQRQAFKSRHARNIAKGPTSAAYWADKVKWSPSKTRYKTKTELEAHEFAGGNKSIRIAKILAKKNAKKAKKIASKLPVEVRRGAAMGALVPIPGGIPAGAAVGGAVIAKDAVERAVRKKTGRPYRLFEAGEDSRMKLEPGIYHGSRGVRKLPIFQHEYVAVVPKDGRRVKRHLRKKMVDVGNGRKALVMGAYNKKGKLRAAYKDKVDVAALHDSLKSGKGIKRVGSRMDTDAAMSKMVEAKAAYKAKGAIQYPGVLKNIVGKGTNSNSYARSLLKKSGVRKIEKAGVLTPGADKRVNFDSKCKVMNLEPKDLKKLKHKNVEGRDGLSKTRDVVDISSKAIGAAGSAGMLAGGIAVKKAADRVDSKEVADILAKGVKGKAKEAFPGISRVARALTKKRRLKGFEAHEFVSKKGQLRESGTNKWADPLKIYDGSKTGYWINDKGKEVSVKDLPANNVQVVKAAYNKGKKIHRNAGRVGRFARDAKDVVTRQPRRKDAAGRNKKREWEKAYFKNAAGAAVAGAGVVGYHATLKKNPKLQSRNKTVDKALKKVAGRQYGKSARQINQAAKMGIRRNANKLIQNMFSERQAGLTELGSANVSRLARVAKAKKKMVSKSFKDIDATGLPFVKKEALKRDVLSKDRSFYSKADYKKGQSNLKTWKYVNSKDFSDGSNVTELDTVARAAGWDVRDPRGRSARVFAPGSKQRNRREKHWHEKKENERKLWKASIAAALLAGGAAGYKIRKGSSTAGKQIGKSVASKVGSSPVVGTNKVKLRPRKRPDLDKRSPYAKIRDTFRPVA